MKQIRVSTHLDNKDIWISADELREAAKKYKCRQVMYIDNIFSIVYQSNGWCTIVNEKGLILQAWAGELKLI